MRTLIWAVYLGGLLLVGLLGGRTAMTIYLLASALVVTLFRRPLVLALTRLSSRLGLMRQTIEAMPSAIVLTRAPGPADAARPTLAALAAASFSDAGAWTIPQLPRIHVSLMVQREEGILAAVESASPIGAQVNLHTLYPDGRVVTFTNSELPAPPTLRSNVQRTQLPRCIPGALVARALAERPKAQCRALSVEDAPRVYEQLYADEIRFRKATGT